MHKRAIYCDYNAGAPVRPEAAVAMARALAVGGNASSVHSFGRRARALIEEAREIVAGALAARPENVVFTSGATEAAHLAMATAGAASCIVSAVEHDCISAHAPRIFAHHVVAAVDAAGIIDIAALDLALRAQPKPALVCVQAANNETGVVQPIAKIAALCREHAALLLVDAAQPFGRVPVSIATLDATYLIVSSHKIGGPPGAGALVLAPGAPFVTTRFGGGQERGRRPGGEGMPAIVGFGVAVDWARRELDTEPQRWRAMRDRFESNLPKDTVVFGANVERLPNTSNFAVPGMTAETAVIALDLEGVAVSSGAACSSGKVRVSRVLSAMGIPADIAKAALRVSFGYASHGSDVDALLTAIDTIRRRNALRGAA